MIDPAICTYVGIHFEGPGQPTRDFLCGDGSFNDDLHDLSAEYPEDIPLTSLAALEDKAILHFYKPTLEDSYPVEWVHLEEAGGDRFLGHLNQDLMQDLSCGHYMTGALVHVVDPGTYAWRMEAFADANCTTYYQHPVLCPASPPQDFLRAYDDGIVDVLAGTCTTIEVIPQEQPRVEPLPKGDWQPFLVEQDEELWLRIQIEESRNVLVATQGEPAEIADFTATCFAADRQTVLVDQTTGPFAESLLVEPLPEDEFAYVRIHATAGGTFEINAVDALLTPQQVVIAADASGATAPHGEVASVLDSQNRTHVAWSDQSQSGGEEDVLMYAMVAPDGTVSAPHPVDTHFRVAAPSIIVDDSDDPHLVYFVKRSASGTSSGNYGVYYATGAASGGSFTTDQVSTNPNDPSDNTESLYDCYVNGRPQISLDADGNPVVLYLSDSNGPNSYYRWVILATNSGGWTHEQAFEPGGNEVTHSADDGYEIPSRMTAHRHVAWIDISDYHPRFHYDDGGWTETVLTDYSGFGDIEHAQIDQTDAGEVHFFFWDDVSSSWYASVLDGGSVGTIEQIEAGTDAAGNLFPATVDPVTRVRYFAYLPGSSGPLYVVAQTDTGVLEVPVSSGDVGAFYGKRSLNVRDGFLSVVTFDGDRGIVVHQGPVTLP